MAATPKQGVIRFTGASGKQYQYSLYNPDVANGFVTWATTSVAGSGSVNFITAPENMVLTDVSVVTGIVDTTALVLWLDDAPERNTIIQWADIVNTLQNRSFPRLGIRAGRKVQLASA
jgi:hypothetical protein